METTLLNKPTLPAVDPIPTLNLPPLSERVTRSFHKIAPFWPLKNLIAVNPLQGFEDLPVEEALAKGYAYFQQTDLPVEMEAVNRQTIKWLQVFFDEGQATLPMPLRQRGLFAAWRQLAVHDGALHGNDKAKKQWLATLPENPIEVIKECLYRLAIGASDQESFLTLLLTTLPGWASYVKYRTDWAGMDAHHPHSVTQSDYLAVRLLISYLVWPRAKELLTWHRLAGQEGRATQASARMLKQMEAAENAFRRPLLKQLAAQSLNEVPVPEAQLVFCIDVRSEPFRRALEATGAYQTLGFAGFFGIPVQITDAVTGESFASCPVLLSPKHVVHDSPCGSQAEKEQHQRGYLRLIQLKKLFQSLKYSFTTPFALVESMGIASGVWMGLRTLAPGLASRLQALVSRSFGKVKSVDTHWQTISLEDQCTYAEGALRTMGLTEKFAPLVVFCGHGSATQNNAYATALDCGACGGRHGGSNARVLAGILNEQPVRELLIQKGILIPATTQFVAAEHNTTTDEVRLFADLNTEPLQQLNRNLAKAREVNNRERLLQLQLAGKLQEGSVEPIRLRSEDWAQVRPEWGLARNAAFIVAPRQLTKALNLEGRCFLHSYDYTQDAEGTALTTILTAPMVVAEWINTQYLFSTLDNVAFGGGSKITQNITGKIGIVQGNASDLMTGLSLQSVYAQDDQPYHEPQRLMTVVYAPRTRLTAIIQSQPILQKLFGKGWVQLACLEPEDGQPYLLSRELHWQKMA